jgi:hypothetical protein
MESLRAPTANAIAQILPVLSRLGRIHGPLEYPSFSAWSFPQVVEVSMKLHLCAKLA